jgi:6-pyruvoyltetrahydropterin/6-carboxytetrahydropterin synthase
MRRAKGTINDLSPKDWFAYLLDHTVLIAQDDPELEMFKALARAEVIQLRVLPQTGAECLAQYLYSHLAPFVQEETQGRVSVTQVEVYENHTNSGIYQA